MEMIEPLGSPPDGMTPDDLSPPDGMTPDDFSPPPDGMTPDDLSPPDGMTPDDSSPSDGITPDDLSLPQMSGNSARANAIDVTTINTAQFHIVHSSVVV
ncbi:hypothetical protein Btru_048267 [Bulinus truncatus]|nr:hypothetical protein Btru_048267 [Bulinus truncatus]